MNVPNGLWLGPRPLVLASGSAARRALLAAAGVPITVVAAGIDERAVDQPLRASGALPAAIATHLAQAKAIAVSRDRPGDIVLGADQVLALGARLFTKPADLNAARRTLEALSGQTHSLHSGWALARDGRILRADAGEARLTMRSLGSAFLDAYLATEGERVCASVGAYRLEGPGINLFETVAGDHATILGLPLLPVLAALRDFGLLMG